MLFFLFAYNSYSQSWDRKDEDYKYGLSLSFNDPRPQIGFMGQAGLPIDAEGNMTGSGDRKDKSYSLSISPKYFIARDLVLRFDYSATRINLTTFTTTNSESGTSPSTMRPLRYDTVQQKIKKFALGIEKSLYAKKRFEFYSGLSLVYMDYSNLTSDSYAELRDLKTDTLIQWMKSYRNIPGGYTAGVGSLIGFNIFIHKNIALGSDFSLSLLYYHMGGDAILESFAQLLPGSRVNDRVIYNDSYKGIRFSKIIPSLHLSVYI